MPWLRKPRRHAAGQGAWAGGRGAEKVDGTLRGGACDDEDDDEEGEGDDGMPLYTRKLENLKIRKLEN